MNRKQLLFVCCFGLMLILLIYVITRQHEATEQFPRHDRHIQDPNVEFASSPSGRHQAFNVRSAEPQPHSTIISAGQGANAQLGIPEAHQEPQTSIYQLRQSLVRNLYPKTTDEFAAVIHNANSAIPEDVVVVIASILSETIHKYVPDDLKVEDQNRLSQSIRDLQGQFAAMFKVKNADHFQLNVDRLEYYTHRWGAVFRELVPLEQNADLGKLTEEIRGLAKQYYLEIAGDAADPTLLQQFTRDLEKVQTTYFSPAGKFGLSTEQRSQLINRLARVSEASRKVIKEETARLGPDLSPAELDQTIRPIRAAEAIDVFPAIIGALDRSVPESFWQQVTDILPNDYDRQDAELVRRHLQLRKRRIKAAHQRASREHMVQTMQSAAEDVIEQQINNIGE